MQASTEVFEQEVPSGARVRVPESRDARSGLKPLKNCHCRRSCSSEKSSDSSGSIPLTAADMGMGALAENPIPPVSDPFDGKEEVLPAQRSIAIVVGMARHPPRTIGRLKQPSVPDRPPEVILLALCTIGL